MHLFVYSCIHLFLYSFCTTTAGQAQAACNSTHRTQDTVGVTSKAKFSLLRIVCFGTSMLLILGWSLKVLVKAPLPQPESKAKTKTETKTGVWCEVCENQLASAKQPAGPASIFYSFVSSWLVFSLSQDPQNTATATDPDTHGHKQVRAGAHSSTPLHAVPIFDEAVADGVGHGGGRGFVGITS